jgi:hypothetical protein
MGDVPEILLVEQLAPDAQAVFVDVDVFFHKGQRSFPRVTRYSIEQIKKNYQPMQEPTTGTEKDSTETGIEYDKTCTGQNRNQQEDLWTDYWY